jgi:predicted aldo/keto reductase-like oxidoreductase
MKYRKFGMMDWEGSILGFGTMRLPVMKKDPALINETELIEMIRYAIDHGVNYLDLGYPYDIRQHELKICLIKIALQDGYRNKIKIAATLPSHLMNSFRDFDRYWNEQLQWLQMDAIDFCLLGRMNRENWPRLQGMGVLDWAEGSMKNGRMGQLGFSFHDHFQILRNILESYDKWALCQFQYSYMDVDHDPGSSGIKYASEKGLGVVVTEPLRSGRLIREPLESVAEVWASSPQKRTLADWGLRWVWDHPEVCVVVCDMSNMEQVVENIDLADRAEPDSLTVQELVLVSQVREAYRRLRPIPCPSCRACMPCPEGIDVPRIFELYNDAIMYNDAKTAQSIYRAEQQAADCCTQCGACVNACAKRLAVLDWLRSARLVLCPQEKG